MNTKICTHCKLEKELYHFKFRKNRGYEARCRDCINLFERKWYQENKEKRNTDKRREYIRKWYQENKEKRNTDKRREYTRKYQNTDKRREYTRKYQNTDKWREYNRNYQRQRKLNDPLFKLRSNIRTFIGSKHKSNKKSLEILGCDVETFKNWIENQFTDGMTWGNHGKGKGKWNFDHKVPLSWFDCSKEEELLKANHYSNIKPMWAIDNIKKGNKWVG